MSGILNHLKGDLKLTKVLTRLITPFFLLFFSVAISQTSHSVEWVNEKSGLNQQCVKSIGVDRENRTWLATEMGLYRFDGKFVKLLTGSERENIQRQRITWLLNDGYDESITLLTYPVLKIRKIIDGEIVTPDTGDAGYAGITTSCRFFSLTNDAVRKITDSDKFKFLLQHEQLRYNNFIYADRRYIVNLKDSVAFFSEKGIYQYSRPITDGRSFITIKDKIFILENNSIKLLNKQGYFVPVMTDKMLSEYLKKDFHINSFDVLERTFFISNDGGYYFNYLGKIFKIEYEKNLLKSKFLFSNPTNELINIYEKERDETYFLATKLNGMGIVRISKFNLIKSKNPDYDESYSVAKLKDNFWLNANGWIYDLSKNRQYKPASLKKLKTNLFFILKHNDSLYLQGYRNPENQKFINVETGSTLKFRPPIINRSMWAFCHHNGRLILSGDKTFTIDNDSVALYKPLAAITQQINAFLPLNNDLIVASSRGVYTVNANKIRKIDELKNVYARFLAADNNNSFWVGCYGNGLFYVRDFKVYKAVDLNIDLNTCHAVVEDSFGNLWISTNDGLFTISKKKCLDRILSHRPFELYKFDKSDGLDNNEFNGGGNYPFLKDGAILGFPNMSGFIWFDTSKIVKHKIEGTIGLDNVLADEKPLYPTAKNLYVVPKNTSLVRLSLNFPYYYNRDNLSLEYKFDNQDQWIKTANNEIRIVRLGSGLKNIEIRVRVHGIDNKISKKVTLVFEPRLHETTLFWFGMSIVGFSIIFLFFKMGLAVNKRKAIALEEKVRIKTKDLEISNAELVESKEKIAYSLKEKELLLKEIHHRVKNNLQLIISLLSIQSRRNSYETMEEFMEKGRTRIISMVLIHENLYQNETFEKLNIREYLDNLLSNTVSAYGLTANNISFQSETHGLLLSLETAVPFGLIINELVTNSVKYAKPGNSAPLSISITLTKNLANDFLLEYKDNGVGFNEKKIKKKTFGLDLIASLADQLGGTLIMDTDKKFHCKITFRESINF